MEFSKLVAEIKVSKRISDIDLRDLFLTLLFRINKRRVGRINGRTKLQKIMFILKTEFDLPQKFNYFLYTYGPYSTDLQDAIDTLATFGLIEEKTTHLLDYFRYQYFLTKRGKEVAESIAESLDPSALQTIDMMGTRAKELNRKNLDTVVKEAYKYVEQGML